MFYKCFLFYPGVREVGVHQCRVESPDWRAEEPKTAASLHAQPAQAHLYCPCSERPDPWRWEEALHPTNQRDHPAGSESHHKWTNTHRNTNKLRASLNHKLYRQEANGSAVLAKEHWEVHPCYKGLNTGACHAATQGRSEVHWKRLLKHWSVEGRLMRFSLI